MKKTRYLALIIILLVLCVTTSCDNDTNPSNELENEENNTPKNILPVSNAGQDQIITTDYVILNGTGQDSDGYIVSYKWTKTFGDEGAIIYDPDSPSTAVTGLKVGTYVFTLTVTDNDGGKHSSFTIIRVEYADITPPVFNAGSDQVITQPANSVTLNGTVHESNETIIISYKWLAILGPGINEGTVIIADDTSISTTATGLQKGTYVFMLTVTDIDGNKFSDSVIVIVNENK